MGHFKNGAAFEARVWSNDPSGTSPPMSSVVLIPLTAPASASMWSMPYGFVTVYVAPSTRPAARIRTRPKLS